MPFGQGAIVTVTLPLAEIEAVVSLEQSARPAFTNASNIGL